MAAGKEIRGKIKSVENTKKITKAMEMVAASKMRKAQDRMRAARPYSDKIRDLASNLSTATPEYRHPFRVSHADATTAKRTTRCFIIFGAESRTLESGDPDGGEQDEENG